MRILLTILILSVCSYAVDQRGKMVWRHQVPEGDRVKQRTIKVKDDKKQPSVSIILKDDQEAIVLKAKVTMTNLKTKKSQTATTGKEGKLDVYNLPAGKYRMTVSSPGYSTITRTVELSTIKNDPILLTLKPH